MAVSSTDSPVKPVVLCIAHRGASAYEYENTIPAVERAIEMGMDMVEIDLHLTTDGRLVVFHDYCLNGRAVEDYTLHELRRHRLPNGQPIPTLEEVLDVVQGRCGLYLEVKSPQCVEPVLDALAGRGMNGEGVIVSSFHHSVVARSKKLQPDLKTSVLFGCAPVSPIGLARDAGADYVHFCWEDMAPHPGSLITEDLIAVIRGAGLGLIIWHEERRDELALLQTRDIDGICTDDPLLLLEYFTPVRAASPSKVASS